jgi:transposase
MQSNTFIGVDISSTEAVLAYADESVPVRHIPNRRRELSAWLDSLPGTVSLGLESTGRYHELLTELDCARGLRTYLLNPRALHHYAKAVHRGNKSDPLDAQLIARYLANEHRKLRPWKPPSKLEYQLLALQRRRAKLTTCRHTVRQSMAGIGEPIEHHTQALLEHFRLLIKAIDQHVAHLIASDAKRADLAQRLRSLPGFGPQNAHHQAILLPRVDAHSGDAYIAYNGMDLRTRDSGRLRGRRKLSKHGPAETRRLAWLAAMSAARTDPHWHAIYTHLLDKGRSPIEACNILARKLLRIAYHLYRYGGTYDPNLFAQRAGLAT